MKLKIPDDWNGTDWYCVQIRWPNSSQWFALLSNLLVVPARGRSWDERTGTIKDAQRIGQDILRENLEYTPCEDAGMNCEELRECLADLIGNVANFPDELANQLLALIEPNDDIENASIWPGSTPPDTSAACRVAEGNYRAVKQIFNEISTKLTDPLATATDISAIAFTGLILLTPFPITSLIFMAAATAMIKLGKVWFDATFNDLSAGEFKCNIFAAILEHGELDNAAIATLHTKVDETCTDVVLREFFHEYIRGAGKAGMLNAVVAYEVEIGDSDCSECAEYELGAPVTSHEPFTAPYGWWTQQQLEVPANRALVGLKLSWSTWDFGTGWYDYRLMGGGSGGGAMTYYEDKRCYVTFGGGRPGEPTTESAAAAVAATLAPDHVWKGQIELYREAGENVDIGGWYQGGADGMVVQSVTPIYAILA